MRWSGQRLVGDVATITRAPGDADPRRKGELRGERMTSSTNRFSTATLRGIPGTPQKVAAGWKSVAAGWRICSCDLFSSPLSLFPGWSISALCNALTYSTIPTSAKNATSSSKIPQLSINCDHLTSLFHRRMILHTPCNLEAKLETSCFADLLFCHSFIFDSISLFVSVHDHLCLSWKPPCLHQTSQPQNCCILKIQEIGNLGDNYIKLWFIALLIPHLITISARGNNLNFYWLLVGFRANYSCKCWPRVKQKHTKRCFPTLACVFTFQ